MVTAPAPALLDRFMPAFDVRERHTSLIRAPLPAVDAAARQLDLSTTAPARLLFRARAMLMGAAAVPTPPGPFLEAMQRMGWGMLDDLPGHHVAAGAACQPWLGAVVFRPLTAETFAAFHEPEQVKIAWTLELEPVAADRTRLATETRVVATDPRARARFLRYWRWARFGIIPLRWILLGAIRRNAEAAGRR